MMDLSDLDTNRARLLGLNCGKMYANVIFCRSLNEIGGCLTLPWSANGNVAAAIKILGFDPKSARYQVEFIVSPTPLADGYFNLIAIKVMSESGGQGGTSLEEIIGNFMMSEWRRMGIEFEHLCKKPNGGKKKVGFIFGEKNGLLMVASTWILA